jgi:hypothetical protein
MLRVAGELCAARCPLDLQVDLYSLPKYHYASLARRLIYEVTLGEGLPLARHS